MSFFTDEAEISNNKKESILHDNESKKNSITDVEDASVKKDLNNFEQKEEKNKPTQDLVVPLESTALKMSIISKIKEIDDLYKKGVLEYSQSIHRYNIEIETLKNEIESESKKNEKEFRTLFASESILEYEIKSYDTLHHKLIQKIDSIVELKVDYKNVLEASAYESQLKRKTLEMEELLFEIEEKELALLNIELERINLKNVADKKEERSEELLLSLKTLELEKGYFESTQLHKISYFKSEPLRLEPASIVDTVVMNDDKLED